MKWFVSMLIAKGSRAAGGAWLLALCLHFIRVVVVVVVALISVFVISMQICSMSTCLFLFFSFIIFYVFYLFMGALLICIKHF